MTEDIKMDINFLEACTWLVNRRDKRDSGVPLISGDGRYVVTCGDKGIPNDVDYKTILYLLCLAQDNGWMQVIDLSKYTPSALIKGVRGTTSNPNKKVIDRFFETLDKYSDMQIKFLRDSFVSRDKNKAVTRTTESFHILSYSTETTPPRIEINGLFLERLRQSLHYKHMSLREYRNIGNPTSMRLFELLEKSFLRRDEWKINVKRLADKIGIKAKYISHIIPKLVTATERINKATGDRYALAVGDDGKVFVDNECVVFFLVGPKYEPDFTKKPKPQRPKAQPKPKPKKNFAPALSQAVLNAIPAKHRNDTHLLRVMQAVVDKTDDRHAIMLAESVDPAKVGSWVRVIMGMDRDGVIVRNAKELASQTQTLNEKLVKKYIYMIGILKDTDDETFRDTCAHHKINPEDALAWAAANPDQDPRNK